MIVNAAAVQAIFLNLNSTFNDAFSAYKPLYARVATEVPSSTREESYNWMANLPKMREWLGPRVIQNLSKYNYSILNRDFELTIGVDRNDIEDDKLGIYQVQAKGIARATASHPDELVFGLFPAGFASLCFDGHPFFHDSHPLGPDGMMQSNLGHGALTAANFAAAKAQMSSLVDEAGRPLNIMPDLLVVPPQLEGAARTILNAELIGGSTNIWRNSCDLLVVPALASDPTKWYLIDSKQPVMPFIFQRRKAPQFVQKTNPEDEKAFMEKLFLFGVDSRDNAGLGLWQLAYGSDGTQ